jgi:hypothetical protein
MTAGDLDALGAVLAADARVRFAYVFGVVGGRPIYGRDDVARATAGPSSTSSSTSSPTTTLTSRQCTNVLVRDG